MLIALEGLPAAGKTTSASLVAARIGAVTLRETTAHHPFLSSVYRDDDRYDLEVELAFLLLHSSAWRRVDRSITTIADFSRHKDILFADDMLSDSADLKLFAAAYEHLYAGHAAADIAIYLRATPERCLERARLRWERDPRRDFERGMTLERLERMQRLYEARLQELGDKVLVLDVEDVLAEPMSDETSMERVADGIVELLEGRIDVATRP